MSTTPHSALSITQPPVPVFTPNPACLRTTNIWRISERCSSPVEDCSWLYLGEPHDVQNNALPSECFPDSVRHPATRCPESYSSVKVGEAIHDGTTYRSLHCCPTQLAFTLALGTQTGSDGRVITRTDSQCVATSPSLAGNAPWITTVSAWNISTYRDPSIPPIIETATIDPAREPIIAHSVTVKFAIANGTTCAPNCDTPWTGGPWPVPSPTADTPTSERDGKNLTGVGVGAIVGIILGILGGVFVLILVCWGCSAARKQRAEVAS